MRNFIRHNWSLLLIVGTVIYVNFTNAGWSAGFMTGVLATFFGNRVVDYLHERWMRKHGIRQVHTKIDDGT